VKNKLNYAVYKYLLPHREHRMRSLAESSSECSFAVYWKNQMKYVNTSLGTKLKSFQYSYWHYVH